VTASHNYGPGFRGWGHDYAITEVIDGGRQLRACGWGPLGGSRIAEGDFILLQAGTTDTRYQVVSVEYVTDPADMWFAVLKFAPRSGPAEPSTASSALATSAVHPSPTSQPRSTP
jgi:hypothetical protein